MLKTKLSKLANSLRTLGLEKEAQEFDMLIIGDPEGLEKDNTSEFGFQGNATIDKGNEDLISLLNEALKFEQGAYLLYYHIAMRVVAPFRSDLVEKFLDFAEMEVHHAQEIGNKIVSLNGIPTVEVDEIYPSSDLNEMIEQALHGEKKAIDIYNKILEVTEDNKSVSLLIEEILLEEQNHHDEIEKLLPGLLENNQ